MVHYRDEWTTCVQSQVYNFSKMQLNKNFFTFKAHTLTDVSVYVNSNCVKVPFRANIQ